MGQQTALALRPAQLTDRLILRQSRIAVLISAVTTYSAVRFKMGQTMLLYRANSGQYLAVDPALSFAATKGFDPCFAGQDVPDVICRAFIRECGGFVVARPEFVDFERDQGRGSRLGTYPTPH